MTTTTTAPRIYVGTYAKYNSGSIKGAWIELDGHDADSFRESCLELHADEHDPELMFQDYEGFPKSLYSECSLHSVLWDWLACSEEDRELWEAYAEAIGYQLEETTLEQAQDAFFGEYDDVEHFCEEHCEETECLSGIPDFLRDCIDWRAVWQSALRYDYCEHNGMFFRNN
jgi:antirestriction protein